MEAQMFKMSILHDDPGLNSLERYHTQFYRNSEEHHHAGLPETKFGAKYLIQIMRNKVCSVASTNNNLKCIDLLVLIIVDYIEIVWNQPSCERTVIIQMTIELTFPLQHTKCLNWMKNSFV